MQLTIPGRGVVNYDEKLDGSPVYTFASGQSHVERTFTCTWAERVLFIQGMLGYPSIANAGNNPTSNFISRVIPDSIPDFLTPGKGDQWLYAASVVRCVGVGSTGAYDDLGVAQYQEAEVTIAYEPRTYKICTDAEVSTNPNTKQPDESSFDRYITRTQKPSAEFVTLPRGLMRWVDGGSLNDKGVRIYQPIDFASARLIPSIEIAYTWHEVPFVPSAISSSSENNTSGSFVGCLNLYTFDDGTQKYNPGTLLLLAAEIKPYRLGSGAFVQDITYRMKYFEPYPNRGHNFFLRYYKGANPLIYTKISSTGLNDPVIIQADTIGGSPYGANQAAGTATGVYAYAGFRSLFQLNVSNVDQIVGR